MRRHVAKRASASRATSCPRNPATTAGSGRSIGRCIGQHLMRPADAGTCLTEASRTSFAPANTQIWRAPPPLCVGCRLGHHVADLRMTLPSQNALGPCPQQPTCLTCAPRQRKKRRDRRPQTQALLHRPPPGQLLSRIERARCRLARQAAAPLWSNRGWQWSAALIARQGCADEGDLAQLASRTNVAMAGDRRTQRSLIRDYMEVGFRDAGSTPRPALTSCPPGGTGPPHSRVRWPPLTTRGRHPCSRSRGSGTGPRRRSHITPP